MFCLDFNHAWSGRMDASADDVAAGRVAAWLRGQCGAGLLPALTMPFADALTAELEAFGPRFGRFKHMLILGIGGSALGARALQKAFYPQQDWPNHDGKYLWISDNVDCAVLNAWMTRLDFQETVIVVVSKSGGTVETLAQYFILRDCLKVALGSAWNDHVIIITDAKKGYLREEADREHIASFDVPDNLGGRYSVLSAVGMVPAAFLGLDWKALLRGAASMTRPLAALSNGAFVCHAAWRTAFWAYRLWKNAYDELIFFSYIPSWGMLGAWFAQLWSESLGKDGRGTMPIPAVGAVDQHSLQQMFLDGPKNKGCLMLSCPSLSEGDGANPVFGDSVPDEWSWLRNRRFGALLEAECLGTSAAMAHHTIPLLQLKTANTGIEAFGAVMGFCMTVTLLTGRLMDINPVDQPAVELGKRLARARLGAEGYGAERTMLDGFLKQ